MKQIHFSRFRRRKFKLIFFHVVLFKTNHKNELPWNFLLAAKFEMLITNLTSSLTIDPAIPDKFFKATRSFYWGSIDGARLHLLSKIQWTF